jgi:type I restriction enzyme S subunit
MSNAVQYTDMKDSGIKWIGSVPASWNVRTLYQLATRVNNKNSDLAEQNLLSLSYGKIKRKDINTNDGLLPASFDGYNIIEAGDIVLRLTDLQNDHTSLRVGHATERGIITSAYTTLRPINLAHSRYLYYLIHAFDLKKGFYGMGSGVRQGLNYDEVKELRVVLPSQKEQDAIVAYLDDVCIQIDTLIQEAKDTISEYKQWKESLIFSTLTQGLDSTVPLKESGINWIGRIPESSSVVRMRYLVDGYKAGPFGSSLITDKLDSSGTILVYTPEHIAKQSVENEKNLYLPENRRDQMSQFFVQKGDIIFPIVGSLGRAMLITEDMPEGIINQRLAKFRIKEDVIDMDFFLWFFARSSFYNQFIEVNCRGSFILNLTKTIIYDMPVVLPESLEKQHEIAKYLSSKCSTIDSLIKEKETLLDDLEFYKRSLIYETVTGKRKVV